MRSRRGVTVVEVVIAAVLFCLVAILVFQLLSAFVSDRRTSAARLTGASFLRQDLRLALQKLLERIEQGIEVIEPPPGASASELVFQDVLNERVRLRVDPRGTLVSLAEAGPGVEREETTARTITTAGGDRFAPALPVRVPHCKRAAFTALGPTLVGIELTLVDAGQSVTLFTTARLANGALLYDE